MNRRIILLLVLIATLMFATAVPAHARAGFWIGVAPPVPVVEPPPPPPAPGHVWQPGYWSWDGVQYVWVPGTYAVAPYPRAVWVPPHWAPRGNGWIWVNGHWRV